MTCVIFTMAMFLYPLWVLFVGALVVLLTGLFRKNSFFPSLLSSLVIASCALVLTPYLFFGRPRVIAGPGGIFLFVLDPVNTGFALCLSIICAGLIPQLAGRGAMEARNGEEGASILFSLGLAMGTIFSSDLLTMVFFAEAAYLFFFSMAKKRSYGVYFSVIHDGMFFLPTAAIIVILFFQGVAGGPDLLFAVETFELSCLVLVVYVLLRLLFFPFSLFSERMAGVLHEPLLAGLAVIAAFAGVSMTMKILVIGPGVSFAVLLISLMVAGIYSVLAYRQKDLGRLTACVFFIETACITAAAGLQALMSVTTGRELSLMVCNHFTAAAGMIFATAMLQKKSGRIMSVFFVVFLLAFVGLLPSAGLAGKIVFYQGALGEGGNIAIVASALSFFSLLPVLFYAHWFAVIKKDFTPAGGTIGTGQAIFLGILAANLYLPFLLF